MRAQAEGDRRCVMSGRRPAGSGPPAVLGGGEVGVVLARDVLEEPDALREVVPLALLKQEREGVGGDGVPLLMAEESADLKVAVEALLIMVVAWPPAEHLAVLLQLAAAAAWRSAGVADLERGVVVGDEEVDVAMPLLTGVDEQG